MIFNRRFKRWMAFAGQDGAYRRIRWLCIFYRFEVVPFPSYLPSRKTANRIKTIPLVRNQSNSSRNRSTLNTVADIGSMMPSADAVPAGNSRMASVYRQYGSTTVQSPKPRHSGSVTAGSAITLCTICTGLDTQSDTKVIPKKPYRVTDMGR